MNDNLKFTPGPWKTGDCYGFIIWAPRFRSVEWIECEPGPEAVSIGDAACPGWAPRREVQAKMSIADIGRQEEWIEECKANARLMATAPELYARTDQGKHLADLIANRADRPSRSEWANLQRLAGNYLSLARDTLAKAGSEQ
jgi:hypothetical protein